MKKSIMKNLSKKEKYQYEKELKKEKINNKKDEKQLANTMFNIFITGDVPDDKK